MTQLVGDVKNRVKRLPKPSSIADGLQPIFEAVSNGMHAIHDNLGNAANTQGRVTVEFADIRKPSTYSVTISDNGVGLDADRFKAFCTTDTDFKISRGGKGVGRLLWLDAFEKIHVESTYRESGKLKQRSFDFGLSSDEPIYNESEKAASKSAQLGTIVTMKGLRSNSYSTSMPSRFFDIRRHFASHFLADFLLGNSPNMTVVLDADSVEFPSAIKELLVEKRESVEFESEKYGRLTIDGYLMQKEASSDLDGDHQLHLVSSGRTVETRKIDGLLGLKRLGENQDRVFHACVAGQFLDERVNQERTQFNFDEKVAAELTKECVDETKRRILQDEIEDFEDFRLESLEKFVVQYPSFGFEPPKTLLQMTPANADNNEAFASALIKHKIRADKSRREMVQSVLDRLTNEEEIAPNLTEEIRAAAEAASADENRHLMEYVLRRKFIIEILDALLGKVRLLADGYDTHLENTFHELICPMQIVGDDPAKIGASSHDLWLLDERLAPAKYFASDAQLKDFIDNGDSDRVDLMVWDKVHGLGLGPSDRLERVLLVEFKRPERGAYKGNYVLGRQMNRYMTKLKNREADLTMGISWNCRVTLFSTAMSSLTFREIWKPIHEIGLTHQADAES